MLNYTVLVNTLILVKKTINQLKKNKKKNQLNNLKKIQTKQNKKKNKSFINLKEPN